MSRLVVPIRSFRTGYARLRSHVEDREATEIARRLAHHVIDVCVAAEETVVVTADVEVADLAISRGAEVVREPHTGSGLNSAAELGVRGTETWALVHADLPLLAKADILAVLRLLDEGATVLAPTHDGGTSLVAGRGAFTFRYGPGSFRRHLASMPDSAVLVRRGFLLDVDTAGDARRLLV